MIRTVAAVVVAFMLGTIVTFLWNGNSSNSLPQQNIGPVVEDGNQDSAYQDMIQVKEATIAKLTEENADLAARIETLSEEVAKAAALAELDSFAEDDAEVDEDPAAALGPDAEDEDRRRRGPWNGEPPTPEQQEEFMNRMRGRMVDMWTEEWENASPESKERITAISDYQQELMDGRLAMREAETDADREAIRASLEETEALLRETVSAEQRARIQELTTAYDLNTPEGIDAFISDTRQLMRSPIFNVGGDWGRGSRGGQRGGFGGFGGGDPRGGEPSEQR